MCEQKAIGPGTFETLLNEFEAVTLEQLRTVDFKLLIHTQLKLKSTVDI